MLMRMAGSWITVSSFYWDEVGTIPKIESAEMMFSASRSRKVSIVPMIQSFAQLNKTTEKKGQRLLLTTVRTLFWRLCAQFRICRSIVKEPWNRTVLSGSISRGKNDPSQSLPDDAETAHDTRRTQITAQREFYCVQNRLPPHENKTETVSEMGNHL